MMSQRVVFYSPQFWPQVGIDQMALIDLADALTHRDCNVSIVTRQIHPLWPTQLHFRDSQLLRVPRPLRGPWRGRRFSTNLRQQIESLLPPHFAESATLVAVGIDQEIATLRQIALKQGAPLVVVAGREVTQRMTQSKTLPRAWR